MSLNRATVAEHAVPILKEVERVSLALHDRCIHGEHRQPIALGPLGFGIYLALYAPNVARLYADVALTEYAQTSLDGLARSVANVLISKDITGV